MPDTETMVAVAPHVDCPHCRAREMAIPPEAALKILITEDWKNDSLAFEARPMNQEQAVAAALMANAVGHYWRAFGVELLGARLNALLLVVRERAKHMRISGRIIAARADINARAREAWERGDTKAVRAIEAEPTPDYPGRERDEAWLQGAR